VANVRVISATNRNLEREVAAGGFRADLFYRLGVVAITMPPLRERPEDLGPLVRHLLSRLATELRMTVRRPDPSLLDAVGRHSWPGNVRELENALRYSLIRSEGRPPGAEHLPLSVLRKLDRRREPTRGKLNAEAVRAALGETDGNKARAARLLGVGRATLYRFIDQVGAM
jgi:DNA-binding NtrC family response regulator